MKNKKRYKLQAGVQYATPDTPDIKPDYSDILAFQQKKNAERQGIIQAAGAFSGAYKPIADVGSMAGSAIRSNNKSKGGATAAGAVEMGATGAALGMQLGGPIGAGIGAVAGGLYGGVKGRQEYIEGKKEQDKTELKAAYANANKNIKEYASTDAQSFLNPHRNAAKKGKYKVKSKQPRMIESEGREPVFGPKMKNGKRKLLFYNPDLPTHEEGGVPMLVMPKNRYNNGTNNLMPKKFFGSKNLKSHKKENPDINRVIDPPIRFDDRPKQPISGYDKGSKKVKVYR